MKRNKMKSIVIIILTALVGCFLGMSYFVGSQVFSASTQLVTNAETTGISDSFWEKYGLDYDRFCERYPIERIEIASSFGEHGIPADYLYARGSKDERGDKAVILVHGLGGNRYTNYPLAELFLANGYDVITYDQRSTNENTAQYTTFGYWEKFDLIDCIDYAEKSAQTIGVWGTSFGGATAGLALGHEGTHSRVDFLILDCPVSSMAWMIEAEMRGMDVGLPLSYMTWCGNIVNRIKLGFSYQDADVCASISGVTIPALIINSRVDAVTPYFMGENLYHALPEGGKEIWTVEDSAHAEIWLNYPAEYRARVEKLLSETK